jgi:hypothetical protein
MLSLVRLVRRAVMFAIMTLAPFLATSVAHAQIGANFLSYSVCSAPGTGRSILQPHGILQSYSFPECSLLPDYDGCLLKANTPAGTHWCADGVTRCGTDPDGTRWGTCHACGMVYFCPTNPNYPNVIVNPNVVVIYWNWKGSDSSVALRNQQAIQTYFREIGSGPLKWAGLLGRYFFEANANASQVPISNGSIPYQEVSVVPGSPGCFANVPPTPAPGQHPAPGDETKVVQAVNNCGYGSFNNTVYVLTLPPGSYGEYLNGPGCGINKFLFGLHYVEFPTADGSLLNTCGGDGATIESQVTTVLHHEVMEVITDPFGNDGDTGWNLASFQAPAPATAGRQLADPCLDNSSVTGAKQFLAPISLPLGPAGQYGMWLEPLLDGFNPFQFSQIPGGGRGLCVQSYVDPNRHHRFARSGPWLYHFNNGSWYQDSQPGTATTPGGAVATSPSAIAGAPDGSHALLVDSNHTLWEYYIPSYAYYSPSPTHLWVPWPALPTVRLPATYYWPGKPAVTASRRGRYDVAVVGTDPTGTYNPQLYFTFRWDTSPTGVGSDSAWRNLGRPSGFGTLFGSGFKFVSAPTIASDRPDSIVVFVVGSDGNLWQRSTRSGTFMDNVPWVNYGNPGVAIAGNPAVTSWGDGRFDMFVTGTNGALYHRWIDGNSAFYWEHWTDQTVGLGQLDPGVDAAALGWGAVMVSTRVGGNVSWATWTIASGLGTWNADNTGGNINGESGTSVDW